MSSPLERLQDLYENIFTSAPDPDQLLNLLGSQPSLTHLTTFLRTSLSRPKTALAMAQRTVLKPLQNFTSSLLADPEAALNIKTEAWDATAILTTLFVFYIAYRFLKLSVRMLFGALVFYVNLAAWCFVLLVGAVVYTQGWEVGLRLVRVVFWNIVAVVEGVGAGLVGSLFAG